MQIPEGSGPIERARGELRFTRRVVFVVPVTSQMSPGKTAHIPTWLFPSDSSNGEGNSTASRKSELQGAGSEHSFTAYMTNSICVFIDKCYSTGNFASMISHRAVTQARVNDLSGAG